MLSQQEQISNIKIYKESKNILALQNILESNIKLLNKIANSFLRKNKNLQKEDLISAGKEGLLLAIEKFDFSLNKDFTPYAQIWIKSLMRKYIFNNSSFVTLKGKRAKKNFSNYQKTFATHSFDDYEKSAFYNAISSSHNLEDNQEVVQEPSQEKELENKEFKFLLNKEIEDFSKSLSLIDQYILKNRILNFQDSKVTLNDVAEIFDCSNQNISYREKKIFFDLRKTILRSKYKDLYRSRAAYIE